jgi:hypothetical protein
VRQRLQALRVSMGGFVDIPGEALTLRGAVA